MIESVTAVELVRPATSGRTGPLIMICEDQAGDSHEVFCKLSIGCDQGVINLAREVVSACLAADLGLPVPKPYFVGISEELSHAITDHTISNRLIQSVPVAFGSTSAPNQFSTWSAGHRVTDVMLPIAAATLLFDGIIQNPDRRIGNPNCLVKEHEIRLIDHELAFSHGQVLFWRAPWQVGGMEHLKQNDGHIFTERLRNRIIDFAGLRDAWAGLSDEQLADYEALLPVEWDAASGDVAGAIQLVKQARDNIDDCIVEARRILE